MVFKKTSNSVYDCSIIEFSTIENREGSISIIENDISIPFAVKRSFYIYDIPAGKDRGAHAHKRCHQLLVAACGSFEVEMDDGKSKRTVVLNRPYFGLHIPPGIWAAEKGFSGGSICMVLTSEKYDEHDYLRDYEQFKQYVRGKDSFNG
ncbi:MAG: WxcM-like domain-containing protein [Chlorobium limicola]|uniref:sugar 3,4-ketoisomerase n=1 Tax=Chlorobium limicola TaxID=1092 RepID=UPI0023F38310|nr:FdtA/QdtA family cupin domain-containing protein [Chlorobium limicola]NTV08983.1 WxcM-like domain-containing protein [Chlorobium limicola]NTV20900.1 WxcM-like domain-containing protein [Chlorobium limicola]